MKRIFSLYKDAYGGLSHNTWWLSLVMLINRSGTMVLPFMTLYLTHSRHVSIGAAGFVMALFGAGAICGGIIGGKLTDKYGFHHIQLFALAGGGVMFIVLGQVTSYPLICVCTFILSLVNDSFRPANSAAVAVYSKAENRTRSYSLNRLAINIGWAVGSTLGGFLAAKNYQLLFWIDGITNIGAAVLLFFVLAPAKKIQKEKTVAPEVVNLPTKKSAYRDKVYLAFVVMVMLFAYCFFQSFSTLPVFYRDVLHLTVQQIGIVMAINGLLIAIFEMILVFKLEGRRVPVYYISIGVLLTGISFMLLNLTGGGMRLAVFSMLILTIAEMLSMPFMNTFWITRSDETNRGQYAGLYTVAWATAQVLGPGTGAQIVEWKGFKILWWFIGGVCLLSAVGFKWLERTKIKSA